MEVQRILKKAEESLAALSSLWNELGLDSATQRAHVEELSRRAEEIFDDKLKQERNVRDQCILNIERCRSKISHFSKQLGQEENQSTSSLNLHLLQELGRLNEILEGLERVSTQPQNKKRKILGRYTSTKLINLFVFRPRNNVLLCWMIC